MIPVVSVGFRFSGTTYLGLRSPFSSSTCYTFLSHLPLFVGHDTQRKNAWLRHLFIFFPPGVRTLNHRLCPVLVLYHYTSISARVNLLFRLPFASCTFPCVNLLISGSHCAITRSLRYNVVYCVSLFLECCSRLRSWWLLHYETWGFGVVEIVPTKAKAAKSLCGILFTPIQMSSSSSLSIDPCEILSTRRDY